VDDEAALVILVEELLASLGYEPVGFTDAQRALEVFRRDPDRFDAVLTDERMPKLRGVALAEALHVLRPALPVIVVTGYREAQLDLQAKRSGITAILDKPLRGRELERLLNGLFDPKAVAVETGGRTGDIAC